MSNIKIAHVTEEVSRAMDKMNQEIARNSGERRRKLRWRREKTAEERRERHLVQGAVKLFWGAGLTTFLYFLAHALVLKLPADFVSRIPFEVDPVVHVLWLIGLIPMLSGLGHIIAGLSIRLGPSKHIESPEQSPLRIDPPQMDAARYDAERIVPTHREPPASVTDRTTNILDRDPRRQTGEMA